MDFFIKLLGAKKRIPKETLARFGLEKWKVSWVFSEMNPSVRSRTKPVCYRRIADIEINKDLEGTHETEEIIESQLKRLMQIEESVCAWEARYAK